MIPIAQFVFGTKAASFTAVFEKSADSQPLPIQATSDPEGKATIEVKANGKAITSAKEGTSVVASVANVDEYYEFDHWEITTATEAAVSLISEEDCRNSSVEFTMPSVTEGVRIKAILKERYVTLSWEVMKGGGSGYQGASDLANVEVSVNGSSVSNYTKVKKDDVINFSVTVNDTDKYVFEKVGKRVFRTGSTRIEETFTEYSGTFKLTEWTSISLLVCLNDKTEETARHDIVLTQATGGTITSSNSTAQPNTTVTLTAAPDRGYTLKSWIVKDEQQKTIAVTADKTNSNVGTFTMPKSNVTVTAEFESTSEITPTITSVALVKSADGSLVAKGVPSGDNWTITIPNTVSAETVAKIPEGLSGLNLKIVTPAGVKVKQEGGGGSYEGDWSKGNISCYMPVATGVEVVDQIIQNLASLLLEPDLRIDLTWRSRQLLGGAVLRRTLYHRCDLQQRAGEVGLLVKGHFRLIIVGNTRDGDTACTAVKDQLLRLWAAPLPCGIRIHCFQICGDPVVNMAEQQWAEAILLFHRQCAKTLALCIIGCSAGGAPLFVFLFLYIREYECGRDPNRPNGKCGCQKPDLCVAAYKRNDGQNGCDKDRYARPDGLLLIHALHILSFS